MSSVIVTRPDLPDAVFELLSRAFPDNEYDPRTFWPLDSVHALEYDGETLVAHAGFVERTLYLSNHDVLTAYVEYVAAEPRNSGHGTAVMKALTEEIKRRGYTLAALGAGEPGFYSRLGWKLWRGPTGYRKDGKVFDMPFDENPMVFDLGAYSARRNFGRFISNCQAVVNARSTHQPLLAQDTRRAGHPCSPKRHVDRGRPTC